MAAINHFIGKQALVSRLLAAKEATGKTFTQISKEVGLTNVYTAQLFYNQVNHQRNLGNACLISESQCNTQEKTEIQTSCSNHL